jgi:hypothetical protein
MLLIKNGKILTMAGETYENGYILIDGGKILETGSGDWESKVLKGETGTGKDNCDSRQLKVIDAKGRYVLPGFIDAHCHVGMWEDAVGFDVCGPVQTHSFPDQSYSILLMVSVLELVFISGWSLLKALAGSPTRIYPTNNPLRNTSLE